MGYRESLQWLLDNDDTEWLDNHFPEPEPVLSVTAALVADIFGRDDKKITADLLKLRGAGR